MPEAIKGVIDQDLHVEKVLLSGVPEECKADSVIVYCRNVNTIRPK